MATDGWGRMWTLFHEVLELAPGDRGAFLDIHCAHDPELRANVERMLAGHDHAPSLLDPLQPADETAADPLIGAHIGPYRVVRVIGRGGMGEVYAAEQEKPIRRAVALKLIKVGMDTREVVARFESERQALALMDHANIATVFDAGSTEDGRPYFVMELVDGRPITEYCNSVRHSVRQRLELFMPVCLAVQHAHQKGVIHRDLKPSNVLVTSCDGRPIPKIIDFGIAKAVHQPLTERTLATAHGRLMGTPEYMSPEQAAEAADVDTRADVYSLGVVLYELLTGGLPVDPGRLSAGDSTDVERAIREADPATPSGRLSMLGTDVAEVAELRGTDAGSLRREVRGELDWIVMRALERDRDRRYATAAEFSSDMSRYLQHRPILAGPPSPGYRFRKFLRRHRVGVTVAAALTLTLLMGSVGTTWMAVVASRERRAAEEARDQAREEAEVARAVNRVLDEMLSAPDPLGDFSTDDDLRQVKVVDVLDRATEALKALDQQPAVEAPLRRTLGRTYLNLGMADEAETHFQRAVELSRAAYGPEHLDSLASSHHLARAFKAQGRLDEAESVLTNIVEKRRRVLGAEHRDTLASSLNLANVMYKKGRHDEAGKLLEELIPVLREVLGEEDPDTLVALNSLALVLSRKGRHDEAEALAREALEIRRRVYGDAHFRTLTSLGNLAVVLEERGALEEAQVHLREEILLNRRVLGDTHPNTLLSLQNLAAILSRLGRADEAVPLYREVLDHFRSVLNPSHPNVLVTAHNLARTLTAVGGAEEAVSIYREILDQSKKTLGPDHHLVATFQGGLGMGLLRMGRYDEAEHHLLASFSRLEEVFGSEHRRPRNARRHLVELYEQWGRPDRAVPYRLALQKPGK